MRHVVALAAGCALVHALVAAAGGDALSERRAGMAYYRGEGVKMNMSEAVRHLARAVDLGDAESAIRLGKMYEYGMGVPADDTQAALWYTRGAELGNARAQFEASIFYYRGRGVARDPVEAVKWWTLALRELGSVTAIRASIESAELKLPAEQLARGRELAQLWLAQKTRRSAS